MTILIILSILVFFLAALVFGTSTVSWWKKDISMSLGFLFAFAYSALSFAVQTNGFLSCKGLLEKCIQYPQASQIPIVRVGLDLISTSMQSFLSILLTLSLIFFLVYVFKQQSGLFNKAKKHHN